MSTDRDDAGAGEAVLKCLELVTKRCRAAVGVQQFSSEPLVKKGIKYDHCLMHHDFQHGDYRSDRHDPAPLALLEIRSHRARDRVIRAQSARRERH
jgi:hypothetical protein